MISKLRWRITVGNLESEDDGQDETYYGDCREDDNMLVTRPIDREVVPHELKESRKRERTYD